jgi:hypothetical protein
VLRVDVAANADPGILRALVDSGFTAEEWLVRHDATHGKSKTYRLSKLPSAWL